MRGLKGLATGIGSVPHKDALKALGLVFNCCPQMPYWPQLPKRDSREGMIVQFTEGFPCLKLKANGLAFEPQEKEKELEQFYEKVINREVASFEISRGYAEGLYAFREYLDAIDTVAIQYIKCHITGPFTFAASIKDDKGILLLHDPVFMQVVINGLAMKALWQAQFFRKFGKKIIVFVDEPYLGCFGSAYTPINREEVIKGLLELTAPLSGAGLITGVHCCGNTDWSIFTEIPTLDIINFDAFEYQDKFLLYADDLNKFLKRDGVICWGIVPTQETGNSLRPEVLAGKIEEGISTLVKKGIPRDLLLDNMLLSPSCGLGSLDEVSAEAILKSLTGTSALMKKAP